MDYSEEVEIVEVEVVVVEEIVVVGVVYQCGVLKRHPYRQTDRYR